MCKGGEMGTYQHPMDQFFDELLPRKYQQICPVGWCHFRLAPSLYPDRVSPWPFSFAKSPALEQHLCSPPDWNVPVSMVHHASKNGGQLWQLSVEVRRDNSHSGDGRSSESCPANHAAGSTSAYAHTLGRGIRPILRATRDGRACVMYISVVSP